MKRICLRICCAPLATIGLCGCGAPKSYATLPTIERDPTYDNPYGVYHSLLAYNSITTDAYTKEQWLPSVGYIKDGKVQGVMFDSIILLPPPRDVHYTDTLDTKEDWAVWRERTYENLRTLNEAAAEVQTALNLKEYKVKVFPTIWMPSADRQANWGSLDGVALSAKDDGECMTMVKYMIDAFVAEIGEKAYSNVELVGFYWFNEKLTADKREFYIEMNDHIKSKGLFAVHAPYYKTAGHAQYAQYGFALNAMQSNYFHNKVLDGKSTTGSIARLRSTQMLVLIKTIAGITVECPTATDHDDVTTLKNTYEHAIRYKTTSAYHMYYFGTGALAPYDMSRSEDAYIRAAYDEMYMYFNHTLTEENIWIEEYNKPQERLPDAKEYL